MSEARIDYLLFYHLSEESDKNTCDEPLISTVSQEGGDFIIKDSRNWYFHPPFPHSAWPTLRLCFESPEGTVVSWDYSWIGPVSTPAHMKVECDLTTKDVCRLLETNDKFWYPTISK